MLEPAAGALRSARYTAPSPAESWKAMETLVSGLVDKTLLVVSTESELLRYLSGAGAQR